MVSQLALGLMAVGASALPHYPKLVTRQVNYTVGPDGVPIDFPYVAPLPTDSRAPCPALNTLANHGFLPHDGRNLSVDMLSTAILNGFHIENSTIATAIDNAFQVCEYVEGRPCDTLTNLTVLAEPHAFEHEHSFSREDYKMAYANGATTNNQNFNQTIFQTSLDVIGDQTHVPIEQFHEIQAQRESLSLQDDILGWFEENRAVSLFESGFIFAVMGDFNLPDYLENPQIRVEWWKYWWMNESFPYPLGWHPPQPPKDVNFVSSVSARILAATLTSTPSPLPFDALVPTNAAPGPLPPQDTAPVEPLVTDPPYVSPQQPVIKKRGEAEKAAKRQANDVAVAAATSSARKVLMNPYMDKLDVAQIGAQQAYVASRMASLSSQVTPAPKL